MKPIALFTAFAIGFAYAQVPETKDPIWRVGQTVLTDSGPVTGHDAGNNKNVSEYLGIPFAQPPTGDLRFAAPKKFEGSAPIIATKFGPSCSVAPSSTDGPKPEDLFKANLTSQTRIVKQIFTDSNVVSEDCLYLNIWTKPQTGEKKKAVLVWVYGGAFSFGSSAVPVYNGRNLAAQEDVVVFFDHSVSIKTNCDSYRLSIFGFPGHPNGTFNTGILDQRLAVEWVRDNIEKFGGDASRITLFGQSAGAASIDYHTYAWASNPIVSSVILQSGSAYSWGLPSSQSATTKAWFETSSKLGCGDAASPRDTLLSCMRAKSTNEIFAAFPSDSADPILGPFVPTVDNTVIFANYSQKKPADIPMLLGSNDYEAGLFRTEFAIKGLILPESFWTDFNYQEFTCPCSDRANASLRMKSPLWRYRYMGNFSNLEISPYSGSYHAVELPILFNVFPETSPSTLYESRTADYMRGAWSTFAKNPTTGLTEYGWPVYDPTKDTLIRIGSENIDGPNLINPYRYDADCQFFNVSSLDPSKFTEFPDLGANVTPTSGLHSMPSATSSVRNEENRTTIANPATTTPKSSANKSFFIGSLGLVSFFVIGISPYFL
ncbi:Acetylcholinesterase [Golovinomyces cichoracearum]|uniref:Carboxylic ester hydrolase n=1 Tax=Golovinomyces cichoracearum TaxID=62708 RepID=A0A420ICX9_9PEZI|nr:Acetylcholinesterase [Golovinomyces cichoracearum]